MGLRLVLLPDVAVFDSHPNIGNLRSPVEHFLSSVYVIKNTLLSGGIESAIRGATKDIKLDFLMAKQKSHRKEKKMDGFKVKRKISDLSKDILGSMEDSKKASFVKFPLKVAWGNIFYNVGKSPKIELTQNDFSQMDIDISQSHIPLVDEEKPYTNSFLTVVTQTLLLGNSLQDSKSF